VARGRTEAEWRLERWRFLSQTAATLGARVVTAHTRDDQVETVFMRALRGAGPRGLAGLEAGSAILRPLLATSRAEIVAYADRERLRFVTDPSNSSRRHLRNRVRLDLLPAIAAVQPSFRDELLELGRKAADWRARIEALALSFPMMTSHLPESCSFERAAFRGLPAESLRVLWPALAARAGVVMDWRGTDRLAAFTIKGETGQTIQLAGNIEVRIAREAFVFQKRDAPGG
jgi:tRNA(Ile)-lysidine synthase